MCDRSVASAVLADNPTGSRMITQDEGGCVHSSSGEV